MRKPLLTALLMSLAVFFCFQAGCRFFGVGPVDEVVSVLPGAQALENGPAEVSFKIVLPDSTSQSPLPSVRAAAGSAQVTFRLTLVNAGDPGNPVTFLTRTVTVDGLGTANVSFSNIPLRTVVGEIRIEGGNIGGRTDFHGATDLTAGVNILEVSPKGCGHRSDMLAQVIFQMAAIPDLIGLLPRNLAGTVLTAGAEFLASPTATMDSDILDRVIGSAIISASYTRLIKNLDGRSLQGIGPATWSKSASEIWAGTSFTSEGFGVVRFLRQGFGGFAYVLWENSGSTRFAVTRIDAATGNRLKYLVLDGPAQAPAFLCPTVPCSSGEAWTGFPCSFAGPGPMT